ncbi:hypothetical protein PG993_000799 [Apiospora rasikravindrae]|uniref:Uncharacterized protein n=1 Tax=Apiospora rasikravindrae TaxID=990691 RepID=A0ABR1U9K9_9PEZI
MAEKGSSAGDGGGDGEIRHGNGDYNLPDFVGQPNAPQRLELQRLADKQEMEQKDLEAQQAQALASSQLFPMELTRLLEQHEVGRRRQRERHQEEQQRLREHQQQRSPHHPRLQFPWPPLYEEIHQPPSLSAGLRTNAGVGQRWKAPFVGSPLRSTTNADAVASPTTSTTRTLTPPSEETQKDNNQKEGEGNQPAKNSKARREGEKRRERQAEIREWQGEVPPIESIVVKPEDSYIPEYFLPHGPLNAASEENQRACPSRWTPRIPRTPLESKVTPPPTRAEWDQRPVTYYNDGTPHPRPGEVLPLPPPLRKSKALEANHGSLRATEVRETRNPQPGTHPIHPGGLSAQVPPGTINSNRRHGVNMNAGIFNSYQPTSHERGYHRDSVPYYSQQPAERYYNNSDFHHPQPTRMHNIAYGPHERPLNAVDNDDRPMNSHDNYNAYPTPYASAAYHAPPRYGNEDGLELLSSVAAAQPPASSLPSLPQSLQQHSYYRTGTTTPPPSSPLSAPTSGRNITLSQLQYLGQGPPPPSAPAPRTRLGTPRPQVDNDETEVEDEDEEEQIRRSKRMQQRRRGRRHGSSDCTPLPDSDGDDN